MEWHSLVYGGIIIAFIYGLGLIALKKSDMIEQLYQIGKKEVVLNGCIVLVGVAVTLFRISRVDVVWEKLVTNNIGIREISMLFEWILNKKPEFLLLALFMFGIVPALCVFALAMSRFSETIIKTNTPSYYFLLPSVLGIALTFSEAYTLVNTIIIFLSAILLYVLSYCINTGFSVKRVLLLSVILLLIVVAIILIWDEFNIITFNLWIEVVLGMILCVGMKYAYYLRETLYRCVTIVLICGMIFIQFLI